MSSGSKDSKIEVFIKPALTDSSTAALSSAIDPIMHSSEASSVLQMGNGIPQYRDLERFQSFALASQLPKRPSPVDFGFQLISLLSSTMRSFT